MKKALGILFIFIVMVGLICGVGTTYIALLPPQLNLIFHEHMSLESSAGQMTLEDFDFTKEPGEFNNFEDIARFFERQEQIFRIISEPEVIVHESGVDSLYKPQPRRLVDLPLLYWIQIIVGWTVFVISGRVFCLRKADAPSSLFFLGGFFILLASFSSAIYTTRELALPRSLFEFLGFLNAVGGGMFASIIVALFLVHPVKVKHASFFAILQAVIFSVWVALYAFRIIWANVNLCIVLQMTLICFLFAYQLWLTRSNSETRDPLTWIGISVIFGGGAFVVFNTVPVILRITPLNQGYSFVFLLFIFFGMSAGLTHFKVFRFSRWIFNVYFYFFGLVAFALLDAGFVAVFGLDRWRSAGLTFLLLLCLYLPLGDALWKSFTKKS